jgi:hypothetical protein
VIDRNVRAARCAFFAALVAAAGCSGTKTVLLPPNPVSADAASAGAASGQGNAVIAIVVPKEGGARPKYVSTGTKGMTVSFVRGGASVAKATLALTPGSPNCSTVSAGTKCTISIALKACGAKGNCYLANVSTYDAVSCKGKPSVCSIPSKAHELSTEQKYPVGISSGYKTRLTLTLAGIPVAGKIYPLDVVTRANSNGGYDLIGSGPHALVVEFLDAAGEIIAGKGAPSLKVSAVSGGLTPVVVATPPSTHNEISVTPPGAFDGSNTAAFTVAPSYAGQATNGCTARNANCSPLRVEVDMLQMAVISNESVLQIYALGETSPLATLQGGRVGLARDASGNLYTGDSTPAESGAPASLIVFSPPLTDGMAPSNEEAGLLSLAQVQNGGAYAQFYAGTEQPYSFQFCSSAVCVPSTSGSFNANSVAADSTGDTAQAQWSEGCQVQVYQAAYKGSTTYGISSTDCAQSMVFDPQGDVFLSVPGANRVAEISPIFGVTTISTGTMIPYRVAVDGNGNLLCAGQDSLTLAATLQETLAATLAANQGGTIASPDHSIVIEAAANGEGTASEALTTSGDAAYVQYSFLSGSSGRLAAYSLPGLTQIGSTLSNTGTTPIGLIVSP